MSEDALQSAIQRLVDNQAVEIAASGAAMLLPGWLQATLGAWERSAARGPHLLVLDNLERADTSSALRRAVSRFKYLES